MNIVLHEPEIPSNTGNIGRTCVATGTTLHLIRPLGFLLNDKMLKRAGMDYWQDLDVRIYDDFNDFLAKNPGAYKIIFQDTENPEQFGIGITQGNTALADAINSVLADLKNEGFFDELNATWFSAE